MADHDLTAILESFCPVNEWDLSLVGFEPSTQPVDPAIPEDIRSLRKIVLECQAAATPHQVVVDDLGFLCVWRKSTRFWD